MKKSTVSKVILMLSIIFAATFNAQRLQGDKLVFGKAYTKDELKDENGIMRCASTGYEKYLQATDPKRMTDAQFESWIKPLIEKTKSNKSQNGGIVTIPVVVHVIHSGQAYGVGSNITDEQVQSQITVMNNDYRKAFGTPGYNTNAVGADIMIQFALAKVDPNGNPTNGINRVNLCQTSWSTDEINGTVKPQTIWNPTQYMNMWSVNFSDNTLLGYAQFPSGSTIPMPAGGAADTDGVVANYTTFGSTDYGSFPMNAPYNKGRTMTHEVGHFLGLRHIWGDTTCGTDFCADTPTAHTANYSCNTAIASCDDASVFEMVRNYMDYTNDTCMNIFTLNQKDRITAVMNNSPRRVELKTSTKDQAIPLFANDAELKAEKICSSATTCGGTASVPLLFSLYNRGTAVLTSAVISYTINGGAVQTYNWTGNLAQDKYAIISITATESSSISAQITSVNGTSDARASNNNAFAAVGGFTTTPVAGATAVSFTLQPDFYGTETTWTLKNSAGATLYSGGPYADGITDASGTQIVSLPALDTQTWNLPPDCYVFTINDSYGDGIELYGYYNVKDAAGNILISEGSVDFGPTQSKTFKVVLANLGTRDLNGAVKTDIQIYPNPVSDILNVTKVSDKATYKIYSAAGQLVGNGNISNGKINVSSLIKGAYVISIEDKGKENFNSKFIKK